MRENVGPLDIERDVVPLFAVEAAGSGVKAFLGTGFLISAGLVVSCWHCVHDAVEQGLEVCAATLSAGGSHQLDPVSSLERDASGSDLASGNVPLVGGTGLSLCAETERVGTDLWTYGYPLTSPPDEEDSSWKFDGRYLQGYVTRHLDYGDARIPSYELDMRAPAGLSGAPVMRFRSTEVVGVVYGVTDVRRIEEFASVDPGTGEQRPEVQRVESFALAHQVETLANLSGAATGGETLERFLADTAAKAEADLAKLYGR